MRRILLSAVILAAAAAFIVFATGATSSSNAQGTYKIELDNAFGLVQGADFKVAGVRAGSIKSIDLDQKTLHAIVNVQVTEPGFGAFRSDAFCQSRPQSLIGEYTVDCDPGRFGTPLKSCSVDPKHCTVPVTHTQSTIPADLVQDVMRLPYRERLTLIINELGAGVAARGEDLQEALQRAVPALTQTDNLLNLLANDSHTIQQLNVNADTVISALADNSTQVQRFIDEANSTATNTAAQAPSFQATWAKLPGFLEQLRPALVNLGQATDANLPVLNNLNAASGDLRRFFVDLVPFSNAALPSLQSLGQTSVIGKSAVQAAGPTVADLNRFAQPTPELAQNLAIVGHDLDDRGRAVEADARSPQGAGYTGLEALLMYVFNQTLAVNEFSTNVGPHSTPGTPPFHMLAVDAFANPTCSPYATPTTIANNLKLNPSGTRACYAWLGPNQIGVNEPDPTNGGQCPDPGGHPPYAPGPGPQSCAPASFPNTDLTAAAANSPGSKNAPNSNSNAQKNGSKATAAAAKRGGGSNAPPIDLQKSLGAIASSASGSKSQSSSASTSGNQTSQLLNYLLAP